MDEEPTQNPLRGIGGFEGLRRLRRHLESGSWTVELCFGQKEDTHDAQVLFERNNSPSKKS